MINHKSYDFLQKLYFSPKLEIQWGNSIVLIHQNWMCGNPEIHVLTNKMVVDLAKKKWGFNLQNKG